MSEELTRFVESYSSDSMYIKKAEPVSLKEALQKLPLELRESTGDSAESWWVPISYYEKALDHSDCSDDMKQEIQFNVIVCYEKLEDWDNAKAKLEDYVTAYPDDEKAAKEAEFLKTRSGKFK